MTDITEKLLRKKLTYFLTDETPERGRIIHEGISELVNPDGFEARERILKLRKRISNLEEKFTLIVRKMGSVDD